MAEPMIGDPRNRRMQPRVGLHCPFPLPLPVALPSGSDVRAQRGLVHASRAACGSHPHGPQKASRGCLSRRPDATRARATWLTARAAKRPFAAGSQR